MSDNEALANSEFSFPFAGKDYKVKKATLRMVMDFQRKTAEIGNEKDPAADLRIAAYAMYLVLHAVDSTITEEWVIDNAPGDVDSIDIMTRLGFLSQRKVGMFSRAKDALANQTDGEKSSGS